MGEAALGDLVRLAMTGGMTDPGGVLLTLPFSWTTQAYGRCSPSGRGRGTASRMGENHGPFARQRVVVVITLGLALGIVASYLTGLGVRTGWYACAPLSWQLRAPGIGEPGWLRLIIWLAALRFLLAQQQKAGQNYCTSI